MTIKFDSERSVYVDSEKGDYMDVKHENREFNLYSFVLFDKDGKGKIGIETQQFVTKFHEGTDREDGKSAACLECFIKAAWIPNTSHPENRNYIPENHPLIAEISRFLIARREEHSRPGYDCEFKITVAYKSSVQELKEKYSRG